MAFDFILGGALNLETKICNKCGEVKELTEVNFYLARPRIGHKKIGWQSYCRLCWRLINKANKLNMLRFKTKGLKCK